MSIVRSGKLGLVPFLLNMKSLEQVTVVSVWTCWKCLTYASFG
jgi:hypothetical protein